MYHQQRSIPLCIFLTIVTCGLYNLYWFYCVVNELNAAVDDHTTPNGGTVILLSLVTCGIYSIYYWYKAGEKVDELKDMHDEYASNTNVLFLIVSLLGFGIVNLILTQQELNRC